LMGWSSRPFGSDDEDEREWLRERREKRREGRGRPILAIDFHGVIHSHQTAVQGAAIADDPPVEGAIEFLDQVVQHFHVAIVSARFSSTDVGGVQVMRECRAWLERHGLKAPVTCDPDCSGRVYLTARKPKAKVLLDDRAVTFDGTFPDPAWLLRFEPWNRQATPMPGGG
jgi:hypothetical protein